MLGCFWVIFLIVSCKEGRKSGSSASRTEDKATVAVCPGGIDKINQNIVIPDRRGYRKFHSVTLRYDSIYAVSDFCVYLVNNQYLYVGVGSFIMEPRTYKIRELYVRDNELCFITDTIAGFWDNEELKKAWAGDKVNEDYFYCLDSDTLYLRRSDSLLWEFGRTPMIEACDLPYPGFSTYEELHGGPFIKMEKIPRLFYFVDYKYVRGKYTPVVDSSRQMKLLKEKIIFYDGRDEPISGYEINARKQLIRGITEEGKTKDYLYLRDDNPYIWVSIGELDFYWIDSIDVQYIKYREE